MQCVKVQTARFGSRTIPSLQHDFRHAAHEANVERRPVSPRGSREKTLKQSTSRSSLHSSPYGGAITCRGWRGVYARPVGKPEKSIKPSALETSPSAFPGQIRIRLETQHCCSFNSFKTDERPNDYLHEEKQTPASANIRNCLVLFALRLKHLSFRQPALWSISQCDHVSMSFNYLKCTRKWHFLPSICKHHYYDCTQLVWTIWTNTLMHVIYPAAFVLHTRMLPLSQNG